MKEMSESEYWSLKFRQRNNKLMEPEEFIKDNTRHLNKGSLLDLACGDGRNAIYLAKNGFDVTGVDFSDEAIKRLEKFSEINNVSINKNILDLNDKKELIKIGKFNNIIISHYKPTIDTFKVLPDLLNKDGILIICTFNYRQAIEKGFPRKYCLEENELINVSNKLLLVKHEVLVLDRGYLDGYLFRLK